MAAFLMPGGWEIWIILGVVILIFGPTQLPKLAKMIGKSAKTLKEGIDGKLADDEDEKPKAKPDEVVDVPAAKKDGSGDDA
jgi:sec-independent protein translocase protein TatA